MRIAKRILSICLTFLVATTLLSALACVDVSAATSGNLGGCKWTVNGTVLTISGNGYMYENNGGKQSPWGTEITRAIIEDGVKSIAVAIFKDNTKLKEVSIGDSVEVIEDLAFSNCYSLTEIVIPDNVSIIYHAAFENCTALKNVEIGSGLNVIFPTTFEGCKSISNIEVDPKNEKYKDVNGVLYSKDKETLFIYPSAKRDTEFIMPKETRAIAGYAFAYNKHLERIILAPNTSYIYRWAFSNCESLETLAFSKKVQHIEIGNFKGLDNLKDIYYGGSSIDRKKTAFVEIDKESLDDFTWHYNIGYEEYYYNALDSIKHNMGDWKITQKPTCDQMGERARYCTDDECAYKETTEVAATGHKYSTFVITKKTLPTVKEKSNVKFVKI